MDPLPCVTCHVLLRLTNDVENQKASCNISSKQSLHFGFTQSLVYFRKSSEILALNLNVKLKNTYNSNDCVFKWKF